MRWFATSLRSSQSLFLLSFYVNSVSLDLWLLRSASWRRSNLLEKLAQNQTSTTHLPGLLSPLPLPTET
jgi:hypothetical protein